MIEIENTWMRGEGDGSALQFHKVKERVEGGESRTHSRQKFVETICGIVLGETETVTEPDHPDIPVCEDCA
jgi:hypothetical protein